MDDQRPIASRELRVQRDDGTIVVDSAGTVRPILIEIYAPVQEQDSTTYVCRYKITGLTRREIESSTAGVDAIQAMHLCIIAVATWMEVGAREAGGRIEWADGGSFNNLELPRGASSGAGERATGRPYDKSLGRDISAALAGIIEAPRVARESLRKLRRIAFHRGLADQVIKCLEGELAVARAVDDADEELKALRALARHVPSAANLAALAGELEMRGQHEAARIEFMRAASVVEDGSELESMLIDKLRSLSAAGE